MTTTEIHDLLCSIPGSKRLSDYLRELSDTQCIPEVKSYSDAVYFNYYVLGLSLQFAPKGGYRPRSGLKQTDLEHEKLSLDSIYIYNIPETAKTDTTFSSFPLSPLSLSLKQDLKDKDGNLLSRPPALMVTPETSGKDFVGILGEPDRKGGGSGPSSGSIGIWCEWTKDGLMVEFGGDDAKGPQAWERGKDAIWKIITIFTPS